MKIRTASILLVSAFILLAAGKPLFALSSLRLDTDYRIRGVSYTNNDFDKTSSTDSLSYYSQRLKIDIAGQFEDGLEIGARLTAVGVAGSTQAVFPLPYPRSDFTPFVESAYIKMTDILDWPVDIIAGKQRFSYGNGLIIDDNGAGFTGFRIRGRANVTVPLARIILPLEGEIFTAKAAENFRPASDSDLYGGIVSTFWKKNLVQFGYFEEQNRSGSPYLQGPNSFATSAIVKQFLDLRISYRDEQLAYLFEVAKQGGYVSRTDANRISFDGMGYVVSGELTGQDTRLGKVAAHALLAVNTGDDDPLSFDNDEAFSPTYTRQYDGTERAGYGELFAATPQKAFVQLPQSYSGINTLNLGVAFSPLYPLTLGVDYFLYSASKGQGGPEASSFERIFGGEFNAGIELDLSVKYVHSKYIESRFTYARYTPPKSDAFWPPNDPNTRYLLEISAKF